MILGIALLLVQILFGLLIFGYFDPKNKFSLWEFILSSIASGITIGSFLILLLALLSKSLGFALVISSLISLAIIFWRISELQRILLHVTLALRKVKKIKSIIKPWVVILALVILVYFVTLPTILFHGQNGSLKTAFLSWGDTALHLSIIERFANVDPFELTHPMLGGVNLTYPFLIDFISGIFLKLGMDKVLAFALPLYILGFVWMILIFSLSSRYLNSKSFALVALVFIVWGSGLGFTTLFKDLKSGYEIKGLAGITETIKNPPHDYTHLDNRTSGKTLEKETNDNIVWLVPIISFFTHQRTFTLGLTLFAIIMLGLFHYGSDKTFWRYAVFAGLLPFSHGHTFLAVFLLMAVLFWFFLNNWKSWLLFALTSVLIALPQITFFRSSTDIINPTSFKPYFGWMTCEHTTSWFYCDALSGTDTNFFIFYLKNLGFIFAIWLIVLGVIAVSPFSKKLWGVVKHKLDLKYIYASLFIFVVSNLVIFQPWPFDNNKVIFYSWLLIIIFAVVPFLKMLWENSKFGKAVTVILIFFSVLAGGFDSYARLQTSKNSDSYGYSDNSDANQKLGEWIKNNTKPNDLFLVDPSVVDPVPLFLSGRPIYLGYDGWLWSEGLDYYRNNAIAQKILSGELSLACNENIKYILLNSGLKNKFPVLNESLLLTKLKVVYPKDPSQDDTKILEVICE
ncbi:MAG: hypothetical protein Q8L47_01645 [bacterium]|nr:hypothetical protein [bacterium]